jgi:hypothetical protein
MPEGPEIWILSKAINKYYHFQKRKTNERDKKKWVDLG